MATLDIPNPPPTIFAKAERPPSPTNAHTASFALDPTKSMVPPNTTNLRSEFVNGDTGAQGVWTAASDDTILDVGEWLRTNFVIAPKVIAGVQNASTQKIQRPMSESSGDQNLPPNLELVSIDKDVDLPAPYARLSGEALRPGKAAEKRAGGVVIEDVVIGKGAPVVAGTKDITVHYTGYLEDGKVFETSLNGGEPRTFILATMQEGWKIGIQGMREGGHRKLFIPADKAYGGKAVPRFGIPANANLIYDVTLETVK